LHGYAFFVFLSVAGLAAACSKNRAEVEESSKVVNSKSAPDGLNTNGSNLRGLNISKATGDCWYYFVMTLDKYANWRTPYKASSRGFKAVKRTVISCLRAGDIYHQVRHDIDIKNLLSIGAVSPENVALIISRARGDSYSFSSHHLDKSIDVHIVKTTYAGFKWYIKWSFLEPGCMFISVHHQCPLPTRTNENIIKQTR
jgi:hypothetical protein